MARCAPVSLWIRYSSLTALCPAQIISEIRWRAPWRAPSQAAPRSANTSPSTSRAYLVPDETCVKKQGIETKHRFCLLVSINRRQCSGRCSGSCKAVVESCRGATSMRCRRERLGLSGAVVACPWSRLQAAAVRFRRNPRENLASEALERSEAVCRKANSAGWQNALQNIRPLNHRCSEQVAGQATVRSRPLTSPSEHPLRRSTVAAILSGHVSGEATLRSAIQELCTGKARVLGRPERLCGR